MKYDIARYLINLDDNMLHFVSVSEETYDGEDKAKEVLSNIIKEDSSVVYDGFVHYYSISDLPSLKENKGIITMTFYASATLDNVTKGKIAEYAKNHRMDCHFI